MKDGIIMIAETDNRSICLFEDELLAEQQVVVKALPKYRYLSSKLSLNSKIIYKL